MRTGLSIVIPCRDDPMLDFTIARIRETIRVPYEIVVIDDNSRHPIRAPGGDVHLLRNPGARGSGYSRDRGIVAARFDAVLTIDAHMNFNDDDWSARIVDQIAANGKDVCCCLCPGLSQDCPRMDQASGLYYGANIRRRSEPRRISVQEGGRSFTRELRRLLPNKWNSDPEIRARSERGDVVEIGSVLGGAYAFSREWYIDGLRRPWEQNHGWGSEEQLLSLANYLLGGRNVLLPVRIGHMFRASAPYRTDVAHMLYNNLRLAHLFLDAAELAAEVEWALEPWSGTRVRSTAMSMLGNSRHGDYRAYLHAGPRTWADYQAQWMSAELAA